MAKKIIVTDKLAEGGMKVLRESGFEVKEAWDIPKDQLPGIIGEYDAIIVRSATKVRGELLEKASALKVIGRAGVGLDNVDAEAAEKKNIIVRNTPAATSVSVAELCFAYMLGMTRDIVTGTIGLREGKWLKNELSSTEVMGKTLGIIGFGRIGREFAKRAVAFGMKVIASIHVNIPKSEPGVEFTRNMDEIFAKADYISFHTPLTDESHHMISTEQFKKMKKGVIIIDCGRGGVIDLDALYGAMKEGIVAKAGLDVFETEPPGKHELFELPNVYGTPHIGAQTKEGQLRAGVEVAELVVEELKKL
ncbi:MAG: hydroxyacid dehydrogenase [Candidatus Odinarchaeota archaeon]